jgi:hypothetical protein
VLELGPDGFPSSYTRIVAWFDREIPVILGADFYRGGRLVKQLEVDPRRVVDVEGYRVPTRMVFRKPTGSETIVEIPEIEIRQEIPKELFMKSALQFGNDRWDVKTMREAE